MLKNTFVTVLFFFTNFENCFIFHSVEKKKLKQKSNKSTNMHSECIESTHIFFLNRAVTNLLASFPLYD